MAIVSIGTKKLDAFLISLRGVVSIVATAFLVSISFRSFSKLSTVVGLKKIACFWLVSDMISFFYLFDTKVFAVPVYNMMNFVCTIHTVIPCCM